MTLKELFTSIANAIRNKKGTTDSIKATDFATEINSITLATGDASANEVLSGKTFSNASGNGLTGTLTNYGAEPQAGRLSEYNGGLYLYVPDIDSGEQNRGVVQRSIYTPLSNLGNASQAQVLSGSTFTSSAGKTVSGTMSNHEAFTEAVSIGSNGVNTYARIPTGAYLTTASTGYPEITLPLSTYGNASASSVLSGSTFTSSAGLTASGTMTNRGAVSTTISPGGSYTIPAGYHNGSGKVSASKSAPTVTVLKHVTDKSSVTYTTTAGQYSSIIVVHSGWGTDNGTGGQSDCYIDGTRKWRISHGNACNRSTCGGLNQTILSGSSSHTIKLTISGDSIGGGILIIGVTN